MTNHTPDPTTPRADEAPAGPEPGYGTTAYDSTPYGQPSYGQPSYGQPPYGEAPQWAPPGDTPAWNQAWDAQPQQTAAYGVPQPSVPAQAFPGAAQYAPDPYATGGYPAGGYGGGAEHPQSTTVLILGILSLFIGITGPFAWFLGSQARREVAANPGRWVPSGSLTVGYVLGIVSTLLMALMVGLFVIMVLGLVAFSV